jgi:hypothetical protein
MSDEETQQYWATLNEKEMATFEIARRLLKMELRDTIGFQKFLEKEKEKAKKSNEQTASSNNHEK